MKEGNRRIFGLFSSINGLLYTRKMYVVEGSTFFDIEFEYTDDYPFERWYIKKNNPICEIVDEKNMLREFFEKSPEYKTQKEYINDYTLLPLPIIAGKFYPRIYRPQYKLDYRDFNIGADAKVKRLENRVFQVSDYLPSDLKTVADGVSQLSLITSKLKEICKTVEPSEHNLAAYGHELRNLLLLASTEVEAQLRGIYKANSTATSEYLQMKDYHKLNQFFKLDEYVVSFGLYPWLSPLCPFENWGKQGKASLLDWYTSYNLVKHDREGQFGHANLKNALNAVCACAILIVSQYGPNPFTWREVIGSFFKIESQPEWNLDDQYFPPIKGERWKDVKAFEELALKEATKSC